MKRILSYDMDSLKRDQDNCKANIKRMEGVIEQENATINRLQKMIDLKELAGG